MAKRVKFVDEDFVALSSHVCQEQLCLSSAQQMCILYVYYMYFRQ